MTRKGIDDQGWGFQRKVVWSVAYKIAAIFYPFSQFCEIIIFLLSLQKQPNAAPILFQRGVECGKYG